MAKPAVIDRGHARRATPTSSLGTRPSRPTSCPRRSCPGRRAFLARAGEHLLERGLLAIALADELEVFEVPQGAAGPLPDVCELDGVMYSSRPTAVRAEAGGFVLERTRETVTVDGSLSALYDEIRLDSLSADQLEHEGVRAGLRPAGQARITATQDYVGSVVVMFRA